MWYKFKTIYDKNRELIGLKLMVHCKNAGGNVEIFHHYNVVDLMHCIITCSKLSLLLWVTRQN